MTKHKPRTNDRSAKSALADKRAIEYDSAETYRLVNDAYGFSYASPQNEDEATLEELRLKLTGEKR